MSAIFYFSSDTEGKLKGSSFGESDGTEHDVELLEGNGHMILRVQLAGSDKSTDLLFSEDQAIAFANATKAILSRLGFSKS